MSVPQRVRFDRYAVMTYGLDIVANETPLTFDINGMALVTGLLGFSTDIWSSCYDPVNTTWSACFVQPATGWSACFTTPSTPWTLIS